MQTGSPGRRQPNASVFLDDLPEYAALTRVHGAEWGAYRHRCSPAAPSCAYHPLHVQQIPLYRSLERVLVVDFSNAAMNGLGNSIHKFTVRSFRCM